MGNLELLQCLFVELHLFLYSILGNAITAIFLSLELQFVDVPFQCAFGYLCNCGVNVDVIEGEVIGQGWQS